MTLKKLDCMLGDSPMPLKQGTNYSLCKLLFMTIFPPATFVWDNMGH